jgi:hypothetical protein
MIFFEILVLVGVLLMQHYFFIRSKQEIVYLRELFPSSELGEENVKTYGNDDIEFEQINVPDHDVKQFQEIIRATNYYLKRNTGSADFNIIKSIADRATSAQENKIASEVSVPLYLGLMGTFLGVILGLVNVVIGLQGGEGDLSSTTIGSFIVGVIIAMVVSLFGLLLTTYNNSIHLKKAIAIRDNNRNYYLNFLQSELLPNLDNSLYSALDQFKSNISDFNTKFTQNLDLFDSSFGDNIKHLKETVIGMSSQIDTVNKNTQVQLDFLKEIKSIGYNRMAEANIKVFDKMKEAGPLLMTFIKEHQNFNSNLGNVNAFAEKIAALFDRITAFEDGLKTLGRDIHQSEMLGSEVINVVKKHLTSIEQKEHLIVDYASRSANEVEAYLTSALKRITDLSRKIETDFDQAFDFNVEGNLMQNLKYLKPLNDTASEMKEAIKNPERENIEIPELKTIISQLETLCAAQQREENSFKQGDKPARSFWSWSKNEANN